MTKSNVREKILDAAFALFYKGGIHATGIDRVVEDAKVTRMTLYRHFPSKHELVLAVLNRRDQQWLDWFKGRVETLATTPQERLLAIYDALGEWFHQEDFYGCAFINAAAEFSEKEHPAHCISSNHIRAVRDYIYGLCLSSGGSEAEALSTRLSLIAEGAIVLAYVMGDRECGAAAKGAARLLLEAHGLKATSKGD